MARCTWTLPLNTHLLRLSVQVATGPEVGTKAGAPWHWGCRPARLPRHSQRVYLPQLLPKEVCVSLCQILQKRGLFLRARTSSSRWQLLVSSRRHPLLRPHVPGNALVQLVPAQPCEGRVTAVRMEQARTRRRTAMGGWVCVAQWAKGWGWDSGFCLLSSRTSAPAATSPLTAHQQTSLRPCLFCRALTSFAEYPYALPALGLMGPNSQRLSARLRVS